MSPTIKMLRQSAISQLEAAHIDEAALDVDVLLAHVLEVDRSYLLAWPDNIPDVKQQELFAEYIQRRRNGEPVAYIVGQREFWSLALTVTPATLIPRPETELLVELALAAGDKMDGVITIADLGTGSGAIAIAIASMRPAWQILAVEESPEALAVAQENASGHGISNITFLQGNWCDVLQAHTCDIIVTNPPYLSEAEWPAYRQGLCFEPYQALVSGRDGLDAIREIISRAASVLKMNGRLFIEHGHEQGLVVRALLMQGGFVQVETRQDLSGLDRVSMAVWPGQDSVL